jgi:hypothetical protein
LLWTHIIRTAHVSLGEVALSVYCFGQSEVPQLDVLFVVKKNVGGLKISVKDKFLFLLVFPSFVLLLGLKIPSMALKQCKSDLHEDFPNEVFFDFLALLLIVVDELCEVSAFAVLHNYVESGVLFVNNLVVAPHNVLVPKLSKDVELVNELVDLLLP